MRRPDIMRLKLIEGLEQAEVDCFLPTVSIHKSFNQFIKFQLPQLLSSSSSSNDNSHSNNTLHHSAADNQSDEHQMDLTTIDSNSQNIYSDNGNSSTTTTATRYIKVITQPLYPTMTRVDPSTGDGTTLARSTRVSSIFREEFGVDNSQGE